MRKFLIRFFCWLLFNIILSIIQLIVLLYVLYMRNIPIQIDPIIKDGVLFFFATALVGSAFFDLWDVGKFKGIIAILCVIVSGTIIFLTLITYPGMLTDSLLENSIKHPMDINKLRREEIIVTILAMLYSFIVKLVLIPQRQSNEPIEEE